MDITSTMTTALSDMNVNMTKPPPVRLPRNYLQLVNAKFAESMIVPIIYVATMMVIGLVGNGLVVYVYGFKWRQSPIKCFITTLAVFDLINCLITMPTEIAILTNFYFFDAHIFCKVSRFSTFWMNNSSVVLLFAIAIDRFIKICLPSKQSFDYRKAKWTCVLSSIIGFCVSWPALFIYGNKTFRMPPPNGPFTAIQCRIADGMEKTTFPIGYYIYLWVAFLAIALVMIGLYALIGIKIWIQKSKGDKRKSSLKTSLKSYSSHSGEKERSASVKYKPTVEAENTHSVELSDDAFEDPKSSDSSEEAKKVKLPEMDPVEKREPRPSTSSKFKAMTRSISISKSGLQAGKATMMLFLITLVYILSFLPYLIVSIQLTTYASTWYLTLAPSGKVAVQFFLRSYLISNTANAIIYGFGNVKFRDECRKLFQKLLCCKK